MPSSTPESSADRGGLHVRPFVHDDIVEVLELFRAMHAESWYRDYDFDDGKVLQLFEIALTDDSFFAEIMVHPAIGICGYFFGAKQAHYFGNDTFACDFGLYVQPELRGTLVFRRMLHNFETWAVKNGCKEVVMGVSSGIKDARVTRFYQLMGYHKGSQALHKKCL
jgi:GNAT superfamily N-acetyltransferase